MGLSTDDYSTDAGILVGQYHGSHYNRHLLRGYRGQYPCHITGKVSRTGHTFDLHHPSERKDVVIPDSHGIEYELSLAKTFDLSGDVVKCATYKFVDEVKDELIKVVGVQHYANRLLNNNSIPGDAMSELDLSFRVEKREVMEDGNRVMRDRNVLVMDKQRYDLGFQQFIESKDPYTPLHKRTGTIFDENASISNVAMDVSDEALAGVERGDQESVIDETKNPDVDSPSADPHHEVLEEDLNKKPAAVTKPTLQGNSEGDSASDTQMMFDDDQPQDNESDEEMPDAAPAIAHVNTSSETDNREVSDINPEQKKLLAVKNGTFKIPDEKVVSYYRKIAVKANHAMAKLQSDYHNKGMIDMQDFNNLSRDLVQLIVPATYAIKKVFQPHADALWDEFGKFIELYEEEFEPIEKDIFNRENGVCNRYFDLQPPKKESAMPWFT